jgi:hypothetical protein
MNVTLYLKGKIMRNRDVVKGMRVSIANVNSVSAYLHGAPGIVENVNAGTDFNGQPLFRVTLLEERRMVPSASPVTSLACRADQIDG